MLSRKIASFLVLLAMPFGGTSAQTSNNADTFTYQGYLKQHGQPVSGICDFHFSVHDALTNGFQVGVSQTVSGVMVTDGVFSAQIHVYVPAIPFSIFNGQDRWLQIAVNDCAGGAGFTTLAPRQVITPAPYASYAVNAGTAATINWYSISSVPSGFADGTDNDTTYTAGSGLALNGTQFSVSGVDWSDLSNVPSGLADGVDNDTTYTAGSGLALNGTQFNVSGVDWSALSNVPGGLADGVDNDTTYTAGAGLGLVGTQFNITAVNWNLLSNVPAGFADGADNDTTYSVGAGLSLTGTTISIPTNTFWKADGNSATLDGVHFVGTTDAVALDLRVNNLRAFRLEPATGTPNIIGGYNGNNATSGVVGAAIAGGGANAALNRVTDNYGVIGGGYNNQAGDGSVATADRPYATVGGGQGNTASGNNSVVTGGIGNAASGSASVVGGGQSNNATGANNTISGGVSNSASSSFSTVGGGVSNNATGNWSTVSGGRQSTASGQNSMVPGGGYNTASGAYSLAAGDHVIADDDGAFIWGDSTGSAMGYMSSPGGNTFSVQASGGIWLGTNRSPNVAAGDFITTSTGAHLTSAGVWASVSDRNAKTAFESIDARSVLERVASMPISSWRYKLENNVTRHIGPMAQDFHAAFGLGSDDTSIGMVDGDGVSLAAIQGLNLKLQDEISRLKLLMLAMALMMAAGFGVIVFQLRR
jgi:hypothetical protein